MEVHIVRIKKKTKGCFQNFGMNAGRPKSEYLGSKMDGNGELRVSRNEELHNLYRPPNKAWVVISRRLR